MFWCLDLDVELGTIMKEAVLGNGRSKASEVVHYASAICSEKLKNKQESNANSESEIQISIQSHNTNASRRAQVGLSERLQNGQFCWNNTDIISNGLRGSRCIC